MTSNQVQYIVETLLKDKCNEITPLLNNQKIVLVKANVLFTDIERYRYKFDTTNNLLIRYIVQFYSYDENNLPSSGHYDIYEINGKKCVYEYLTDANNNVLCDIFDFDKICEFVINDIFAKGYAGGLY